MVKSEVSKPCGKRTLKTATKSVKRKYEEPPTQIVSTKRVKYVENRSLAGMEAAVRESARLMAKTSSNAPRERAKKSVLASIEKPKGERDPVSTRSRSAVGKIKTRTTNKRETLGRVTKPKPKNKTAVAKKRTAEKLTPPSNAVKKSIKKCCSTSDDKTKLKKPISKKNYEISKKGQTSARPALVRKSSAKINTNPIIKKVSIPKASKNQPRKKVADLKKEPTIRVNVADLTCSVCLELYNDPITLTCNHTFCRKCIMEIISLSRRACPLCRSFLNIKREAKKIAAEVYRYAKANIG